MRRYLIALSAFLLGSSLIALFYFGILTWAQSWDYALSQFQSNRWYVISIWISFGIQAALYSILRFRLFVPTTSTGHTGALMGTSGGTSATALIACCLHHVTDVLPILGLSAAATFLTRYQRPFMLISLGLNLIGIIVMLTILHRERQKLGPVQKVKVRSFEGRLQRILFTILFTFMFVLAACVPLQVATLLPPATSQTNTQPAPISNITPTPTDDPAFLPTLFPNMADSNELTRIDEQGAVVIEITPLNIDTPMETLEFDVAMNTHSVDLGMDLALLSTLSTDTGVIIQPAKWDATPGGHHLEGKLIFPAMKDGKPVLEDASTLTLIIVNVDAASRIFEWKLK